MALSYIELAKPVYHVSLLDKIISVLRCVCFHCSKLRFPREHSKMLELKKNFADRPRLLLQYCSKLCSTVKRCGDRQPESTQTPEQTIDGIPVNKPQYGCGSECPRVRRNPENVRRSFMEFFAVYMYFNSSCWYLTRVRRAVTWSCWRLVRRTLTTR